METARTPSRWLIAIAVALVLPIVQMLASGPEVPEETFLLISRLAGSAAAHDPANWAHGLARSPYYWVLGWAYGSPAGFLIVGILAHATFALALWAMLTAALGEAGRKGAGWAVALALVVVAWPLGQLLGVAEGATTLVPHDAFVTFSHRTFAWALIAVAFAAFVTRRPRAMLWLAAAGSLIHPTIGILAFGLATLAAGVERARTRKASLAVHWLVAALFCVAPRLIAMALNQIPAEAVPVPDAEWYANMIKNEGDDFSFLYHLARSTPDLKAFVLTVVPVAGVYAVLFRRWKGDSLLWSLAVIVGLFVAGAGAEYLLAVKHPSPFIDLLIPLTASYRLLNFAFFPVLTMAVVIVAKLLSWAPKTDRIAALVGVIAAIAGLGLFVFEGISDGRARPALAFAGWSLSHGRAAGLDEFMEAEVKSGEPNAQFVKPRVYRPGETHLYPGERNIFAIRDVDYSQPDLARDETAMSAIDIAAFADIARQIRSQVPKGQGLFVPPYLRYFRDSLPDHAVFFQERHDGNLMLGGSRVFGLWKPRMIALVGADYDHLPSKASTRQLWFLRTAYLATDDTKAAALYRQYPAYRYFVIETGHELGFTKLAGNAAFTVYDLARPNR